MPPVQVSPGMQWFFGWHIQPSDPAMHSVVSTAPEAPAGITHAPFLQTPLAQSGPVVQVVFGSITVGMQSPPSHTPLSQSLAIVHCEPAGEPVLGSPPELAPPLTVEPPFDVEPPLNVNPPFVELSPPGVDPPESIEP